MKVAIGADHGGYELKESIKRHLVEQGIEVEDFGTHSPDSVDYAIIAEKDNRIAELTDKAAAFENFAEQLTALFGVLEETANTSVGKKIGNLLSGKK